MIPVLYRDKVPVRTPGETMNTVLLNILHTIDIFKSNFYKHQQKAEEIV